MRRTRPAEKGEADKALEERQRLYRHYTATKRAYRDTLYKTHPCGPDLATFAAQLQRYTLNDAAPMHTYICQVARNWLSAAPPEIRAEALSLVNERIIAIRIRAGLTPFDDPLPGESDDLFQRCKQELS